MEKERIERRRRGGGCAFLLLTSLCQVVLRFFSLCIPFPCIHCLLPQQRLSRVCHIFRSDPPATLSCLWVRDAATRISKRSCCHPQERGGQAARHPQQQDEQRKEGERGSSEKSPKSESIKGCTSDRLSPSLSPADACMEQEANLNS